MSERAGVIHIVAHRLRINYGPSGSTSILCLGAWHQRGNGEREHLVSDFQEAWHSEGHDYIAGSPHLKHPQLKARVEEDIRSAVSRKVSELGHCAVLEIGAGHGFFTETVLSAGGTVIATEMSQASAKHLAKTFDSDKRVSVIHDPKGDWVRHTEKQFDLVLCVAVLHHIPDYIAFMRSALDRINKGGMLLSWQDPLYYPRRSRANLTLERSAYFAWRLTQGNLRSGFRTRLRRLRGTYDESNPSDMVEYHVVRDGVDEQLIIAQAADFFEESELTTYFSTYFRFLMWLDRIPATHTSFRILLSGRK